MKLEYTNNKANEATNKFKLLSSYGGPGSIIHTEYGSIIISCIEEWGFLIEIQDILKNAEKTNAEKPIEYVKDHARVRGLELSNDTRLLEALRRMKGLDNLDFLVLLPDIELNEQFGTIKNSQTNLAIASTYMPKGFFDRKRNFKSYKEWHRLWGNEHGSFHPPKYVYNQDYSITGGSKFIGLLRQDNIVLICNQGHISDFPWSKYLRWRRDFPNEQFNLVDLFKMQCCCDKPEIQITDTNASATGFDGKYIKCISNGCKDLSGTSLKGIMSIKLKCPGHKPWEASTGDSGSNYYGDRSSRHSDPPSDTCHCVNGVTKVKISLTTSNDLYYSKIHSSLFMPELLFKDVKQQELSSLEKEKQNAVREEDFILAQTLNQQIKILAQEIENTRTTSPSQDEQEEFYRYQEYVALTSRSVTEINNLDEGLQVRDVTENLNERIRPYFKRILRVDNLKVTMAQLSFSRIEPVDADAVNVRARNIFRSLPEQVRAYPVVENYGEGVFFSFDHQLINEFKPDLKRFQSMLRKERNSFAETATNIASRMQWPLYLIHTFCHLIMRELEFRCGYPTASLSERLYVSSNDSEEMMYGCLIYTSEGEEGSMGGLVAQTRKDNLNDLINSALYRATVCNSDPLCWESDGQGLFELNLASCFSCSLVSETSCEQRNLYLDRRILIDGEFGFFKDYDPSI